MLQRARVKSIGWLVVIAPCFLIGLGILVLGIVKVIAPGGTDQVEWEEVTRDRTTGAVVDREELTGREKNRKDGWNALFGGGVILGIMTFAARQKAIAIEPRDVQEAATTIEGNPVRFAPPDEWMSEALGRLDKDGRIPFAPVWLRRDALDLPARAPWTRGVNVGLLVTSLIPFIFTLALLGPAAGFGTLAASVAVIVAILGWRRRDMRKRRLVLPLESFQMNIAGEFLQVRHGKEIWRAEVAAIENGEGLPAVYQALVERRTRERLGD